jgi:glycosyltransferase involved in cell wall biosynthesis
MDKTRISIIIPVYNAEDYLSRCLDSILVQDMNSYEVILVDDGSTDSSALICDRYSATDPRFRTIHKPNGGVSSARNAGLNLAKGEYVMFVDSDDSLAPGALSAMSGSLNGEEFVLGGFIEYIGQIPHRNVTPGAAVTYDESSYSDFFDANIRRNCEMLDAPWAKLFKRKSLGSLRFNEQLSYAEDKLFVFEFLSKCRSIYTCPSVVYNYHLRPGSLGSDISSERHIAQLQCFLPLYADVLKRINERVPSSRKAAALYHRDLVGRYICRLLNLLATRRSSYCTTEFISTLYGLMQQDNRLGLFSVRAGQVVNILLYKLGSPSFAKVVYKLTSSIVSCFKKR